jgi:hypothetical protein
VLLDALGRGGVAARMALPGDAQEGENGGSNGLVWPLALLAEPGRPGPGTGDALRFRVRYLVVATGTGFLAVLDRALRAVAGRDGMLVVPEPVPVETWRALGAVPRAALLVDVPAQVQPAELPAPARVLSPLRLVTVSLRPLHGQVVGEQGVPLAGVRIEATGTGRAAYTDARGGFTLAGLPDREPARLVLFLRDRQLTVDVDPASTEPVLIHCKLKEV